MGSMNSSFRVELAVAETYYDDCFVFRGAKAPEVGQVIMVESEDGLDGEPLERHRARVIRVLPGDGVPVVAVEVR